MRRVLACLAALALFLLTAAGMKNAGVLAQSCRSVSLRYRQPLALEIVEAAQEKQPGLTFWCEQNATLATPWRQAEATVLYYWGDASLVLGRECHTGNPPAPLDTGGCAVSTALAWQLFGSEEAVGLTLCQEEAEYTVRAVFESSEPVALLPRQDAAFTAVELPAGEETAQDPAAWTDACLVKSGLPEPDWRLYTLLPAALARLLTLLPLTVSVQTPVVGSVTDPSVTDGCTAVTHVPSKLPGAYPVSNIITYFPVVSSSMELIFL